MLKGVFYDCDECAFTSDSKEEEENEEVSFIHLYLESLLMWIFPQGKIFCYQCNDPYTKRVYWCCNACNYSRTENSWLSSSLIKSRKE